LSRQIQKLEGEFGTELIDRSSRLLGLTSAGRLFYEQAIQILARADDMRSMIRRAAASERRRFVVGFVASTIYARLPPLIRAFRAAAPNIDLSLVKLVSMEQIAALKEGRIDIGFGRVRFEDDAARRTVLREELLVAAVPEAHPLAPAGSADFSPADLAGAADHLSARARRQSYADQVLVLFHDRGLEPQVAQEARDLQIAIGLVAAEEGICLVPETVQKSRVDDVCGLPEQEDDSRSVCNTVAALRMPPKAPTAWNARRAANGGMGPGSYSSLYSSDR
jgi:DNA-binding transcriptional LysR family regulator